mmetsp:Transcript_44872/g.115199  ORF Transcript_44872/g.115199 Transcript_44872/m.115199 type:complete len:307 (-) Transcript_44872:44-964(-)
MGSGDQFAEPLTRASAPSGGSASSRITLAAWVLGPTLVGLLYGLFGPIADTSVPTPWDRVSSVLGWSYFCAWSVSFYPQVVQNFRRRSAVGLSLDYQLLNLAGFSCYFAFNAVLYYSPVVQQEYRDAHDGKPSAVRLNDVVFAGHALILTAITLVQIAVFYDYPPVVGGGRLLRLCVLGGFAALILGSAGLGVAVASSSESFMTWLTYFGVLAQVKVLISLVKYCPQVCMNYSRQTTDGWCIENVLLDWTGGLLSVAQLVLDGWATADWSAVTGDPAKFLLGNVSMFFDVIFMVQHYCLYRPRHRT